MFRDKRVIEISRVYLVPILECWPCCGSFAHWTALVLHAVSRISHYAPLSSFMPTEYYPNCEVVFMGMANIHAIRNSFQYLRAVCSQMPDPSK